MMALSYYFQMSFVLSVSTVITTVLQYLSGVLVCHKYIQKKSTGDASGFPFICGFLSCSMWLKYGFLTDEKNVILVNTIGATLFFCYVVVYWVFTINKRSTFRQLTCAFLILISAVAYTQIYEEDKKQAIEIIGYICCAITVIFFAAPCCMLMHVIRFKNTEILPFPLIFTSFLVSIQWFAFGLIINDLFLQIPNLAGAILSGTQLLLFLIYPNKPKLSSLSPETTQPYSIFNNA